MLTFLGIVLTVLTYGTAVEPRLILDVERKRAVMQGLPAEWEGKVIAVTGDFQLGMWWDNEAMVRKAVARIVEERPAAVLLLGDFVYGAGERPQSELASVTSILRPLAESGVPTFAVLGNHDRGLQSRQDTAANREVGLQLRETLQRLGITVLHNKAVALSSPGGGEPLWIVGIGSRYAGEDEPLHALREVPAGAPRVVFMHHPDSFEEIPAGAAPLAVAGHTHGGQVALPFTPDWSWLTFVRGDEVHADGWIDGYGARGNRLYVNRGIGFSLVPIRIGAAPEVTLFRLEGEGQASPSVRRSDSDLPPQPLM